MTTSHTNRCACGHEADRHNRYGHCASPCSCMKFVAAAPVQELPLPFPAIRGDYKPAEGWK